jgi:hypothetical protein
MFEDCDWAGETSHGQARGPVEDLSSDHMGTQNRKKAIKLERATGIEPA